MVVLLAVIAPVLIGYAWPVSAEQETIYNVLNTQDITADYSKGTVNIYQDYYDLYANNYNVYSGDGTGETILWGDVVADTYLDTYTTLPYLQYLETTLTLSAGSDGRYHIDPSTIQSFVTNNVPGGMLTRTYAIAFPTEDSSYTIYLDGVKVETVFYYTDSGIVTYLDKNFRSLNAAAGWSDIAINFGSSGSHSFSLPYAYQSLSASYADASKGFDLFFTDSGIQVDTPRWFNGYDNQVIDLLIKFDKSNTVNLDFLTNMSLGSSFVNVKAICNNSNQISLSVSSSYVSDSVQLGTRSQFPYVLLRIDANTGIISLSGMPEMTSFLDNYNNLIRKTVSIDTNYTITSIKWMDFYGTGSTGDTTYLFPHTVSNVVQSTGIVDSRVNYRPRTTGDFQIQLANTIYYPIGNLGGSGTIQITAIQGGNTYSYYGSIDSNGDLTFTGTVADPATVPFDKAVFSFIGNNVYLNGQLVIEFPSYMSQIYFGFIGGFILSVYYSDLEQSTHDVYGWASGGFGLDVSGFCIIGVMASIGAGLAAMLAGKRSGAKAGLILFTAMACASVYLIVLMGGL